jgi:hypothetical protein
MEDLTAAIQKLQPSQQMVLVDLTAISDNQEEMKATTKASQEKMMVIRENWKRIKERQRL